MDCSAPGLPVPHHLSELPKFMTIESVMPSNHLILCHLLFLPLVFPSIRVFSWRVGYSCCGPSSKGLPLSLVCFLPLLQWELSNTGIHCSVASLYCTWKLFYFLTKWRFVATLHWASLSVLFFQHHLFTSCLHVSFWYDFSISKFFTIIVFVMVICDQWSLVFYCSCSWVPQTLPILGSELDW